MIRGNLQRRADPEEADQPHLGDFPALDAVQVTLICEGCGSDVGLGAAPPISGSAEGFPDCAEGGHRGWRGGKIGESAGGCRF